MNSFRIDRRSTLRAALLAAMAGLAATPAPLAAQGLFSGEEDLERVKTEYNDIIVRRGGGSVTLYFVVGRCEFPQSSWRPADPDHLVFTYTRAITAALAYPTRLDRMLEIGLGGGRTSMYVKRHVPGLRLTSVEIDPGVIAIAKKHFGVVEDARLRLVADDGRRYVTNTQERYDLIVIDAYRGTWVPETLTTVEFFQRVKARLRPGGVVAQNVEPTTLFFDGMLATLRAVFANVDVLRSGSGEVNAVLIGYDGPAKSQSELEARARSLQARHRFRHPLPDLFAMRARDPVESRAQPFRDGFERANELLMIDRANDADTPRQRSARCRA